MPNIPTPPGPAAIAARSSRLQRQWERERDIDRSALPDSPDAKAGFVSTQQLLHRVIAAVLDQDDNSALMQEVTRKLEVFGENIETLLRPPKGRPSTFVDAWQRLQLQLTDRPLLFYIVLFEVLQATANAPPPKPGTQRAAVLAAAATAPQLEHDTDSGLNPDAATEGLEEIDELEAATDRKLRVPGLLTTQQLYSRIWQSIVTELALRRQASPQDARFLRRKKQGWAGRQRQLRASLIEGFTQDRELELCDGPRFAANLTRLAQGVFSDRPWFTLAKLGGQEAPAQLLPLEPLRQQIEALQKRMPLIYRNAPLIVRPKTWGPKHGVFRGGYYFRSLIFYKLRQHNRRTREFLQYCQNFQPQRVFSAVNMLQNTPWRVNRRVWDVVARLLSIGGVNVESPVSCPPHRTEEWRTWVQQEFVDPLDTERTRPGSRLASKLTLNTMTGLLSEPRFHFAYHIDSRGRIYPAAGWLSPQGESLSRALLEFATPKPITRRGAWFLALYGSQQIKRERIIQDLQLHTTASLTLRQRVRWIRRHETDIRNSAADPLNCPWWRKVAGDSAFVFLAFCFAWRDYCLHGPEAPCWLPVQVDGTCNGLQHIAALTGDETLARSTNLLTGNPRDIYLEVANEVRTALSTRTEPEATFLNQHAQLLDRKTAKSVVMIIPYGAGLDAYTHAVAQRIAAAVQADQTLRQSLQKHFDLPVTAAAAQNRLDKQTRQVIEQISAVVGAQFSDSLHKLYPVVRQFKTTLTRAIRPVLARGMPVVWITPSGLPVLQCSFQSKAVIVDSKLLGRVTFTLRQATDEIDSKRQSQAILPNFVHSLDSTHLVYTLESAYSKGVRCFSMVHDSFGTHAADMPILADSLRQAFVSLYGEQGVVLEGFLEWLEAMVAAADSTSRGDPPPTTAKGALTHLVSGWSKPLKPTRRTARQHPRDPTPLKGPFATHKVLKSRYFFS